MHHDGLWDNNSGEYDLSCFRDRFDLTLRDFWKIIPIERMIRATLAEEIGLVNNYIYIINVRFSGEIHFIKEIEEGVTDVPMPAMILQPLVENSINHGLRDVEWEKKIWLSVYRENDRICVSVRDNGIGISPEQTQSILNNDLNGNGLQEHTTGVGLRNVIGRLRLFYNRDDVMEITSTGSGMGTEVAVFIPV